jgi:glycerol uptake facilitator-like aquaporin
MFGRRKIAAIVAEFLGTAVLASTVLAMIGRTQFPFFAAIAAGLTLGLMVLVIGPFSGAHINPAVTLGLWSLRKMQTIQSLVYIVAQVGGGLLAWKLSEFLLNQKLQHIATWGVDWRVLLAEAVGAFVFTFGVAAAVYQNFDGLKLAAVVGGSLSVGILVASIASNGLVNPAVAVGVNSLSWAYAAGPLLGGVIGMNLYGLLFAPIDAPQKRTRRKK